MHEVVDVERSLDGEITFGEYLAALRRYVWLVATLAFGGAMIAWGWSWMKTPLYEATASLVIDRDSPSLLDREREVSNVTPDYLQTHFELLKGEEVLRKTAGLLNLSQRPEYQTTSKLAQFIDSLRERFSVLGPIENAPDEKAIPADAIYPKLGKFRRHIAVSPVRGSRVVHITVQSQDPEFAAKAANTLASVYIDNVMEMKADTKEKASKWFSTHLEELRRKVEESEFNLYAYRSKYGLMDAHERQTVAAQQLSELNSELVKAEMKRADAQSRHKQIGALLQRSDGAKNWSGLDDATEILNSPLIQVLRAEEIKASARLAELTDKYGRLHPKMIHAETEFADLQRRMQGEMLKIYNSIKHEYDAAAARVRVIREAVERHKQQKIKLEQHEVEHAILDREAQSNRQLYDTFLRQMKETNLTSGMLMSSMYLGDPAVPPDGPVSPRTSVNIVLGMISGLLCGVGVALVLNYQDHSLKGPDDVERFLPHLPLLGLVPVQNNGHKRLLGMIPVQSRLNERLLPVLQNGNGSRSSIDFAANGEYYRTIRTNILLSSANQRRFSILITSPRESEGKTTVAVNLAVAMAQLEGLQVVLVNADLRKSGPRKFFGSHGEDAKGLTHYLMGEANFETVIYPTEVPNLFVVPHGTRPDNPSELLHSKKMADLLKQMTENGFQVLVDGPPVLSLADSVILSAQVDAVLMIISEGETTRESCRGSVNRIRTCGGRLIGVVLQKARFADVRNYVPQYPMMQNGKPS